MPRQPGGEGTLLHALDPQQRAFVSHLRATYRLTHQELRIVAQAARDLAMWREGSLESWWRAESERIPGTTREEKHRLMARLQDYLRRITTEAKVYPPRGLAAPPRRHVSLRTSEEPRPIFGRCPVHSERTVCCGLYTLDAVLGCSFDCSYCTIQTFFDDEAELPANLPARLREIDLDPERFYHIGTGQSSDSLVWGDRDGMLDALLCFARENPNILLELKSKSDRVSALLALEVPPNVVCSWSLNAETIVRNEEHGTASLPRRLDAARRAADHGVAVAFHFHPLVHFSGWQDEYDEAIARLTERFSPAEVAFVSLGTLTFIKPVARQIRRRGGESKVLQMPLTPDPHGKLTYPDELKIEIYRHLYQALSGWQNQLMIYLCMEKAAIWDAVFGKVHASSVAFEQHFAEHWHRWQHARNSAR
jgi:spore photoproduct lyase